MGRNKNKNIRKITKIGRSSYCVTLPMEVMREFGWRERQRLKLEINKKKKEIIITDWGS